MNSVKAPKILLILVMPLLIFLLVFNFAFLSESFFKAAFSKYGVYEKFPDAEAMHQKVIDYISGDSDELPPDFNDREKEHLRDVKKVISALTITLYIMVALFVFLLVASSFMLKANTSIINFIGRILMWGGIATVAVAILLLLAVKFDFGATFESMHQMLFAQGTYLFDPAKESIVNLYPEQLFMDLGIRISIWTVVVAVLAILLGLYLITRTKNNKKR